ncbi:hypothetical protein BJ973_001223 [Actinoplanes tereljensis]|uniref:HEAT repeat domain-containing protein n=1 Tax=Paractinoplanes tereljensis TaxID=571912 RepID=A0A919TTZ4_9ACTN|nr:hypothetical protein [Actinoplanes tereljensis]GIF20870.1 hypothetical protein Ate02nite_36000 [Actinoplanes tereljensis]
MTASDSDLRAALARMAGNGAAGEDDLRRLFDLVSESDKHEIVAGLGESPAGDFGVRLLQAVASDRGAPADRRCAAIVAVTKRTGPAASGLLHRCLADRDPAVRKYAMFGLAVVGDDGSWAEALEILRTAIAEQVPVPPFGLQWKTLALQSEVLPIVCYLGRHLAVPGRRESVTTLIREHWDNLYDAEKRWFGEFWPDFAPDGPDPEALSGWARSPLFDRVAAPA